MKVVTAHTMQELDKQAINECGISGLRLMENAGLGCIKEIVAEFGSKGRCFVMAGKGNNGGDGFVIARLLSLEGWDVKVIIMAERGQIAGDAEINLQKLPPTMIDYCTREGDLSARYMEKIFQADIIVDALFGTGLCSNVTGNYLEAIDLINASGRPVIAVDIPSGVHATNGRVLGGAVRAFKTITFAAAKLGHILYPGADLTGRLVVVDIGIPAKLVGAAPGYNFINEAAVYPLLRHRGREAHKGDFGHCLIIAGSAGKTGAAALAANSAVRAGSGMVTLAAAESIHSILELKTTEAMTFPLPDSGNGYLTDSAIPAIKKLLVGMDAVAVGPGLGRHSGTDYLVQYLTETVTSSLVIDADGLNALAENKAVLKRIKSKQVILTPHPGEMSRLLGTSIPDVEAIRISVSQEFARNNDIYLVLKGARTIIASPTGAVAINGSGNPGMASGGMGDVLTGIIVSLLGQGYTAWDACCLGVYLHGFAADMVAEEKGEVGINASDVIEKLPYAYNRLLKNTSLSNL